MCVESQMQSMQKQCFLIVVLHLGITLYSQSKYINYILPPVYVLYDFKGAHEEVYSNTTVHHDEHQEYEHYAS